MLKIKDLHLTAGEAGAEKEILHGINLEIADSSFVVLTGPNGGGKTTLAKAVMGLMPTSSGSINYNGTELTGMSITERARVGISYGFQQPPRFKGMRVRDLLELASGRDDLKTADFCRYLNKVGLCAGDYIDREVDNSLSGGEVKRIEIASILARNSSLMIFDEPEAGIDLWSFAKLTDTFRDLHRNSDATIIVISHQERIINLADEIVVLADGNVLKRGSKEEVFPTILAESAPGCKYIKNDAE